MNEIVWRESSVLITGGTGSFGKKCAEILLQEYHPRRVIIFSRDELKQHDMQAAGLNHPSLRYFLGDIRDRERLHRAMRDVQVVIHAAALKQVPACEFNPIEAVKTNVNGAQNIVEACIDAGVKRVLGLSTDKAVNPVNLYGATKLCAEKLLVQGNAYSVAGGTRFACTRYGNVLGSRGSVIPVFLKQRATGKITITDRRMTRFWLTLDQGVRFVLDCIERMTGGEVFVPKIPSMKILDLADAIAPGCDIDFVGIRPGEKLHEMMISRDEARHTLELDDRYIIQPEHSWWDTGGWPTAKSTAEGFEYASDTNTTWMSVEELQNIVGEYCDLATASH
jgi:UDP-N-acetylglucosamine 4,6-dehydratase